MPDDKSLTKNGYASIAAVDPRDGKQWDLLVSLEKIAKVAKESVWQAKTWAFTMPATVQHPTAVYEGLERDEAEEWLCYVSKPDTRYVGEVGHEVPPAPDRVFVVFVTRARVIFNCYWVKSDPSDPSLPEGYAKRFKRRIL